MHPYIVSSTEILFPKWRSEMRSRISAYRFPPIILSLAMLLSISGTVEAGVVVLPKSVQQTRNPQIEYAFSVYLTPGSTLAPGSLIPPAWPSYFTLNNLAGIDPFAVVSITNTPSGVSWLPLFGIPQIEHLPVQEPNGPHVFYPVIATSVTFGYVGGSTITNSTGANELVGNFTITEPCSSIPLLPAGSSIATTYSCYQIKNSCGNSVPILFTVVPEPSSLVVVALVGSSLLGVGLLRRRRRVA